VIIRTFKPVTFDINPGDDVLFTCEYDSVPFTHRTRVKRITEREGLLYVVFANHTWRPLSSFNRTWKKAEE
jgi:hypothetical protein